MNGYSLKAQTGILSIVLLCFKLINIICGYRYTRIIEWMKGYYGNIRLFVICHNANRTNCKEFCNRKKFNLLF